MNLNGMTPQERWRNLAQEQRDWAAYLASRGEHTGVALIKAKLYDDTATSIDLEDEHGEPYCACHLKPLRVMRHQV